MQSRIVLPRVSAPLVAHALYNVAHSLHLFFVVALLQYAVEVCRLPVIPLFLLDLCKLNLQDIDK